MKRIKKNGVIIYRADKDKKVKFKAGGKLYCEIVVKINDGRQVEEVHNDNIR